MPKLINIIKLLKSKNTQGNKINGFRRNKLKFKKLKAQKTIRIIYTEIE